MGLLYRNLYDVDIPVVLGLKLRAEDQKECRAASGMEPEAALAFSVLHSEDLRVIVLDGVVVGVFGVTRSEEDRRQGTPWMLATDALFERKNVSALFSRKSKDVVKEMSNKYQLLTNYVATSNTKAIRWLQFLGFAFAETAFLVDPNVEFVRFWKGDALCVDQQQSR